MQATIPGVVLLLVSACGGVKVEQRGMGKCEASFKVVFGDLYWAVPD